jgi:exosortase K
MREGRLPWVSWGTALVAAYGLKLHYSRAAAEDLAWILAPTARAVGWLRGETLTLIPEGWAPPDGSYVIAPACAGVNFMIVALTVSVLGFAHRLRSPGRRLSWWLASLARISHRRYGKGLSPVV